MANTLVLLERITVGAAGAASVTFNSIPQTGYTDLVVKGSVRSGYSGSQRASVDISLIFNSTSSGYSSRLLQGNAAVDPSGLSASNSGSSIVWGGIAADGDDTANVFSNFEVYIPNYTSSNYKSVSIDEVVENNASNSTTSMSAGLWSNTAAITSINFSVTSILQYSTFSLYGVSAVGTTPTKAPKALGGNIIETDGTYWYHAFLSSGTFTPAVGLSCDVLVVAGGGSGGWPYSGGGGAGGVAYTTGNGFASGTGYTVTIGAGAAGAYNTGNGVRGNSSQFGSLTAAVGGGGGIGDNTANYSAAVNGGSGGGGADYSRNTAGNAGGSATSGQGNAGGTGSPNGASQASGGGGGGAGTVGSNGTTTAGGAGGAGTNAYSSWLSTTGLGVSGYIAGGGGGGTNGSNAGAGGSGGGGRGARNDGTQESEAGTANTGGGSGGGGAGGAPASPKNGGSGLVIVRYAA